MMKLFLDFAANHWLMWLISTVLFFALMVLFGNLWENSGSKESSRNPFLIFLCKLSAVVWQLAAVMTVIALIVNSIRAIV